MKADMEQSFKLGMEHFGHLIHGFDRKDAILSGMETRTSSPLRIKRDVYKRQEKKLEEQYPDITWCSIYIEKNTMKIDISEGIKYR